MDDHALILIKNGLRLAEDTESSLLFLFLSNEESCLSFFETPFAGNENIILVTPRDFKLHEAMYRLHRIIHNWAGNQSRFSRIKYAFLQAVMLDVIHPDSKVVCVLGPWGKNHLDTITIHDLSLSWCEEFPFDPRALINRKNFHTVIAAIDIALDIGALGREGKSIGTTFIIGDVQQIMHSSHQAIFNPFRGYSEKERSINSAEVVESIKELAKLDGAFVISDEGVIEAAGRHLDAASTVIRQLKGFGSRHRAAAAMTLQTEAIAIVVSESTGKVTVFDKGVVITVLEPFISRRVV